jgi:hypothetical protein
VKSGKSGIVGLAGTLLVSGGLAALGLAAGTANAQPGPTPQEWWCPGQPIPKGMGWNMAVCHEYHYETGANGTRVAVPGPPPECGGIPCG